MTHLPVEVGEFEVEEATGEAAEAEVRAEACWAGEQRVGVHSGTLEVGNPRLMETHTMMCQSKMDIYLKRLEREISKYKIKTGEKNLIFVEMFGRLFFAISS